MTINRINGIELVMNGLLRDGNERLLVLMFKDTS